MSWPLPQQAVSIGRAISKHYGGNNCDFFLYRRLASAVGHTAFLIPCLHGIPRGCLVRKINRGVSTPFVGCTARGVTGGVKTTSGTGASVPLVVSVRQNWRLYQQLCLRNLGMPISTTRVRWQPLLYPDLKHSPRKMRVFLVTSVVMILNPSGIIWQIPRRQNPNLPGYLIAWQHRYSSINSQMFQYTEHQPTNKQGCCKSLINRCHWCRSGSILIIYK